MERLSTPITIRFGSGMVEAVIPKNWIALSTPYDKDIKWWSQLKKCFSSDDR